MEIPSFQLLRPETLELFLILLSFHIWYVGKYCCLYFHNTSRTWPLLTISTATIHLSRRRKWSKPSSLTCTVAVGSYRSTCFCIWLHHNYSQHRIPSDPSKTQVRSCHSPAYDPPMAGHLRVKAKVLILIYKALPPGPHYFFDFISYYSPHSLCSCLKTFTPLPRKLSPYHHTNAPFSEDLTFLF